MKNLKIISTILLSFVLMFSITTSVFAADVDNNAAGDDIFSVGNGTGEDENIWGTPNVVNNESTIDNNAIDVNSTIENDIEDDNDDNDVYPYTYNDEENNSTTSNSNSLAYTGIGDSNGMIALIIIISAIVAIYSAKKFNDYKNV